MVNEYCPKCHALEIMNVNTVERNEEDEKGNLFKIITNSYNCNTCNTFVRSEDQKIQIEYKEA
ncbi:hypothetical protein [Clostridium beijerinckii]|uniref:Uncharacterized protein n=1 Tax=Clostridium beijerinckii TaxID=1520 RepID=A0A0B5QR74_CLOBE|nr:hypothetical protein [Clostridium beijerinckii]AJH00767.1 hypothetical protein LF65_04226 [Clostridium beijerinckii]